MGVEGEQSRRRPHLVVCGDDALAYQLVEDLVTRIGDEVTVILPSVQGNHLISGVSRHLIAPLSPLNAASYDRITMAKQRVEKQNTSWRISVEAERLLELMAEKLGISQSAVFEQAIREKAFKGYRVDASTMKRAREDAIFLHCLPAHRGEEVAAEVIDGPQSKVWDEAANRLHVQKAIMAALLGGEKL